jgi:carboxymethylenebutenolidase
MTVLKGEGTHSILYGSTRLPLGRNLDAYISRPDAAGSHPTLILAHGAAGITSHLKGVCRRFSRHGFAVICPDLYRGDLPVREPGELAAFPDRRLRVDLDDAFETVAAEGTEWADHRRLVVIGCGEGARAAALTAPTLPRVRAVAFASPVLVDERACDDHTTFVDALEAVRAPILAVTGAEDELAPADLIAAARAKAPHSEWVRYRDAGTGFLDESAPGYEVEAAADALGRMIGFAAESVGLPTG